MVGLLSIDVVSTGSVVTASVSAGSLAGPVGTVIGCAIGGGVAAIIVGAWDK